MILHTRDDTEVSSLKASLPCGVRLLHALYTLSVLATALLHLATTPCCNLVLTFDLTLQTLCAGAGVAYSAGSAGSVPHSKGCQGIRGGGDLPKECMPPGQHQALAPQGYAKCRQAVH